MHPTLTLPNSPVYQSSDRTDYRQDWLNSAVDPGIIDLNVEAIAGADLFEVLYPHPQRLNAGRLNAKYLRLWERCVDFDNTPLSHGWICNGRVKILEGPLLKPENGKNGKWKVVKYRNPEGGKALIAFLKVPLHIWEKVAARYGIALPSYIEVTQEGSALGFWAWVLKNQIPLTLTEGEKKAGCLLSLGYAAISIPGISMGWRVTDRDFKGKALARELHPDLQPFDDGREITIAFDYRPGDYFKSPEWVNAAILGKLFKKSTVKIARLPGPQKGIDDFAVAGGDVAQVLAAAESLKQLQDEKLWRSYKGFSPDRVVNQRYLDIEAPEHGKATLINSGLGTGKTQYLAEKIAPQPGKQINIGYRNSLLLQMAQKIGSYHLDEHDGRRFLYDPNARISLCWDSLLKLPPEIFEGADIILDEASSSLKHLLTSSTCKEKRVEILEFLKKIAPNINRIIATDGNNSDLVANWVASVFKLPIVRIKNNFKGDTPPVTFLELPQGRYRIAKAEFEYLAKGIMGVDCPAIATDSLNDAEALYKMFTAQGKKGILLTSKTATKKWAKEFLANPDNYIRKHKPEFIIFTPTAESGLDISIKAKLDSVEVSGKYFSDVFCIFRGVIGVDECLQMSRRVRHPERIAICCAERKFASNNDSNPFSGQLIK
ncbi:MAG TPA: plasmid replication protein, CyRepA1 family, partial [Kamptonema sp.]|nr:plasmid replication protein, CyRepA1 family [Kamptonema sp.]